MKAVAMPLSKSPLPLFLVFGIVVFLLYLHFRPPDRETVVVTTQTIDALIAQQESITQSRITAEERQTLIEGYIEDEILIREAYKRGFDKNDYRVRKRILNIMRRSLSEVVPEPSAAQLRAFYEENRERYRTSHSISFEHAYFSFAGEDPPGDPERFLRKLEGMSEVSGRIKISSTSLKRMNRASFQTIAINFGKPFAQVLFELPLNRWWGPIESSRGIHYVRVTETHAPELPAFEKMESYLRTDYFMQKSRESQQSKIEELRENYEVILE